MTLSFECLSFPRSSFEIINVDNFKLFNIFSSYCFMLSYLIVFFNVLANVMYSYNFRQNDFQIWCCGIITFLQSHNEVQRILEINLLPFTLLRYLWLTDNRTWTEGVI